MKHPAQNWIKYLLIKDEDISDGKVLKAIDGWGFLSPEAEYLGFLRQDVDNRPANFNPANRLHRPSMNYLREQSVFELFFPTPGVHEAWSILGDPFKRLNVEQVLLARLDRKVIAQKLNKKYAWHLTAEGLTAFHDYFWNTKLLTWDEWGRYLYKRSGMYEKYLALLRASPALAFFHLQIEQNIDSKHMLQRAQEIAHFTMEEVNLKPGTGPDKVKAIGVLSKVLVECHEALSTSDMALKDILKNFEKFRMENTQVPPLSINALAPGGNYSESGIGGQDTKIKKTEKGN